MAIPIDFTSIAYISFRLAPFILVSFFSLASLFNQDLKGVIYIAGLLIACFISITVSQTSNTFDTSGSFAEGEDEMNICQTLTLSGAAPISKIPLSIIVFVYTFAYLLYVIVKYHLIKQNMPTLIFFPALVIADILWNKMNNCANVPAIVVGIIIGGAVGSFWAYMVDSLKLTKMQYMTGMGNAETCSVSKQKFKCTIRKR